MVKDIYRYNNPHPHGKHVGDCVKRALTIATGRDYREISIELNRLNRLLEGTGYNDNRVWKQWVKQQGWKKLSFPAVAGQPRLYGKDFVKMFPEGTYLLRVAKHLVTVVDGVYQDTWDSTEKMIYNAWKVEM